MANEEGLMAERLPTLLALMFLWEASSRLFLLLLVSGHTEDLSLIWAGFLLLLKEPGSLMDRWCD